MPIVHNDHIESRQNRLGREKAYIKGTRISVQDIYVAHEHFGQSADEIVADFPHLSLGEVHAALSYAYDHLDSIRQQLQEELACVDEMKAKAGPGILARKLGRSNGSGDPISP
jgi:uncharacterized protein (DUF433 family)